MKSDLELAWCNATPNERADFVESYSDDISELLPLYFDRDDPETEELIAHEQDNGDDETLDSPELPSVLGDDSGDDDGDFPAADDEAFPGATRGNGRHAGGKRVTSAPRSAAEIETLTAEFLARGGEIRRMDRGLSGLAPTKSRVPAWRKKVSSKGAANARS